MGLIFSKSAAGTVGLPTQMLDSAPGRYGKTKESHGILSRLWLGDGNRNMNSLLEDGKWGFTTSIEGSFNDVPNVTINSSEVPEPTGVQLNGRITVSGIAFGPPACEKSDRFGSTRNGVEAALFYYQQQSITSTADSIVVTVGETAFRNSWCVGVDFGIKDANLNLWYWKIKYVVNSEFETSAFTPGDVGSTVLGAAGDVVQWVADNDVTGATQGYLDVLSGIGAVGGWAWDGLRERW